MSCVDWVNLPSILSNKIGPWCLMFTVTSVQPEIVLYVLCVVCLVSFFIKSNWYRMPLDHIKYLKLPGTQDETRFTIINIKKSKNVDY